MANLEHNIRATKTTRYRTASISKWFTATTAMILVNKGQLNLDLPIKTYCSYFPEKRWSITSRQLLTHTAGIRSYFDLKEALKTAKTQEDSLDLKHRYLKERLGTYTRYDSIHKAIANFKDDALLFRPGSDWEYSSQGYRLLGAVLEGASGKQYNALIEDLIFKPLGMNHTVKDDTWEIIKNRAAGYRLQRGKPIRRADFRDVSENLPAGGHLSTAEDLVRFAHAFTNQVLVSKKDIALMTTPYYTKEIPRTKVTWRDAIPSKEKYGYGVMLFPDENRLRYGHTGRQAGGSSIVMVNPEKKITIAILTNVKGWNGYMSFSKAVEAAVIENLNNF